MGSSQEERCFANTMALLVGAEQTGLSHQAIIESIDRLQQDFPLKNEDRVLQCSPLYSKEVAWDIFAPLLNGAAIVLDPTEEALDADIPTEATVLQAPSSFFQWLSEQGQEQGYQSLRLAFYPGETPLQESTVQFFAQTSTKLVQLSASKIEPGKLQATVLSASAQPQKAALPEPVSSTIDSEQAQALLAHFANLSDEEVSRLLLELPQEGID
jgi:non-ribosomal peptide synthetase component F